MITIFNYLTIFLNLTNYLDFNYFWHNGNYLTKIIQTFVKNKSVVNLTNKKKYLLNKIKFWLEIIKISININ